MPPNMSANVIKPTVDNLDNFLLCVDGLKCYAVFALSDRIVSFANGFTLIRKHKEHISTALRVYSGELLYHIMRLVIRF